MVSFDKFSIEARNVLSSAQDNASAMQHNYIGTEHILLGITSVPDCYALKLLEQYGVTGHQISKAIMYVIAPGDDILLLPALTKRATIALELAIEAAHEYPAKDGIIDTQYILYGLLREGGGIAASVLNSLGITVSQVEESLKVLSALASGTIYTKLRSVGYHWPHNNPLDILDWLDTQYDIKYTRKLNGIWQAQYGKVIIGKQADVWDLIKLVCNYILTEKVHKKT